MARRRWGMLAAVGLALACHGHEGEWGWFANPAQMEMQSDRADWSFAVHGADLELRNGARRLVLVGFVPAEGVRYRIDDATDPEILFRTPDGHEVEWDGDRVRRGDEELRLTAD